jgi:hypothetical protein
LGSSSEIMDTPEVTKEEDVIVEADEVKKD